MAVLGHYILDTLQIFFSWDDDLYTYLKERGLGSGGLQSKKLPLIYTHNCESTAGIPERKRNNVIDPKYFGMTYEGLGWKRTERETQPIIPAEKPEIEVVVSESGSVPLVHLNIVPRVGVGQYHLEYSSMSAFGRIYKNWATFYLPIQSAIQLAKSLKRFSDETIDCKFSEEVKQAQREKFEYLSVRVRKYIFSYGGFDYAKRYFEANGVQGPLPSLAYDVSDEISRQLMEPLLKVGFIQTKTKEGFEERKGQVAMKLSQPKFSMTKRSVRGRMKGRIVENLEPANSVTVEAADFATKLGKICDNYSRTSSVVS